MKRGAKIGTRQSLATRLKRRSALLVAHGKAPTASDEMLDLYLSGENVPDICHAYSVTPSNFYRVIANSALFRLMADRNQQLLSEMEELVSKS